jgi:hypothetical protein
MEENKGGVVVTEILKVESKLLETKSKKMQTTNNLLLTRILALSLVNHPMDEISRFLDIIEKGIQRKFGRNYWE